MKRASFTLFQPQRWMSRLGQSALMVLFVWCCLGIQNSTAQVLVDFDAKDGKNTCVVDKASACNGTPDNSSTAFYDDGANDGNYADSRVRVDTVEFCPTDRWHHVKVVFTNKFDVAPGTAGNPNDQLEAYQGNKKAVRGGLAPYTDRLDAIDAANGGASGTGVSEPWGGWLDAECDPAINPTGCLTFILRTNGDNIKGAGWEAWVDCAERDIKFGTQRATSVKLTCPDVAAADIEVPAPSVTSDCGAISDSILLKILNQEGEVCESIKLSNSGVGFPSSVTRRYAIGIYTVSWELCSDDTKNDSYTFSVQAPALVCNDQVIVPLGSACMIALTPDDILEKPCDTVPGVMYYNITVTIGTGAKPVVKKTTGHDNLGAVTYPVITAKDITDAGMSICDGTASVEIERIYYGDRDGDGDPDFDPSLGVIDCNNGPQNAACTTVLRFVDQSKPFVTVKTKIDTLIACDISDLGDIIDAKVVDNCGIIEDWTYTVTGFNENDPCFKNDGDGNDNITTVTVHFSAVDACGNVGTNSKTITLIRPNPRQHLVKYRDIERDCKDVDNGSTNPGLAVGVWANNQFQVKDTVDLSETEYICGYVLTSKDIDIPATDCGRKIYRYWSITDWCNPGFGPSAIDTTFIEFTDDEQPYFIDTTATRPFFRTHPVNTSAGFKAKKIATDAKISLGPFECTYDVDNLTRPETIDNCDDNVNVTVDQVRWVDENDIVLEDVTDKSDRLECGKYLVRWRAADVCHEQEIDDIAYQYLYIKDVTKPSAVCTDELNVSIPGDGGARIHYTDIDAGSVDACGIDKIEIRRKGSNDEDDWGEYVDVLCTDVHNNLQIEMRVTDKKGNYNICWMDVTAEDKVPPICSDLPDMSETCDKYHNGELGSETGDSFVELKGDLKDLYNAEFGDPETVCEDNLTCALAPITQYYKLKELSCGALSIERKWIKIDWNQNESNEGRQNITITYKPDWTLYFPADVDLVCGDAFPAAATAADMIDNGSCDLWALEVTEKTFEVPGDICMKVERTYELINWCVYQAGTPAQVIAHHPDGDTIHVEGNEEVGRYTYTQVLKLYVNEAPTITINPVETCLVGEGDVAPYGVEDETPGAAPFECDEERTFSASAVNCADVPLHSDNFVWKFYVDNALVDEGTGSSFTKVVQPKTKYKVEFWVSDGCGNSAGDDMSVEFWDCKNPTPYVLHGLAVEIMQTGSIQIWATDLDQGSFDNCTSKDKLDIRIAHGSPLDGPLTYEEIIALPHDGKVITFTCDQIGEQFVSIYVIDEEGNWDVVGTYVIIDDNMKVCVPGEPDEMVSVQGKITNSIGENVELVNVSVNAGDETMATGANGKFDFILRKEGDYTITPEKNISPLNGVSTYDLVLISKHILGIQTFDSPYKYIAADVNKSGSITAFDMVQLRQLILNITSEFPNNSSWRFLDATHEFTSANPAAEDFNEFISINNLSGATDNIDFIAAKIGDVNGNAAASSLLGVESRSTNGTLNLNVSDKLVEAGQTVKVDFTSADIASAQGYQFTLNFAGQGEIVEGVAKAANFNTNLSDRGVISTSWNGEATADEVLFSLTFTANTTGLLSELVSVTSDVTVAEAYNTSGELMDVNLEFNSTQVSAAFELNQNTPNPFNGETVVGFNLPAAGAATLTVMDVQGKVLKSIKADYAKGYNTVTLKANELGATGVLYYQLESSDNIATKKMIIIE